MPEITDVREIVSTHIVTRNDARQFILQIIRFQVARTAAYEMFSYTCQVYAQGESGVPVKFPSFEENDPAQLKEIAITEIAKL